MNRLPVSWQITVLSVLFLLLAGCLPGCATGPKPAPPVSSPAAGPATADAVNLLIAKDYTVQRDGGYTLRLHLVRRILTYKGKKDYADFKFTYNDSFQNVEINQAQTTTAAGQVVKAGREEVHDILAPWTAGASIYSHTRQKVVSLPAVEPGSTIELQLTVKSRKGFWLREAFRLPEPIDRKVVTVALPPGMPWQYRQPKMVRMHTEKRPEATIYRWEAHDVPSLVPENDVPAPENRDFCLLAATFADWPAVAAWYRRLWLPALKAAPAAGKAAVRLDDSSVERLYESLLRQLTPHPIDFLETGLQPQLPAVTLEKGYGTQVDLALVFFHLLQQRQLHPRLLLTGSEELFLAPLRPFPAPGLLHRVIVRCAGKDYAFWKQELPPGYTGSEGHLGLDLENGRLVPLLTTYENRREIRLTVHPTGRGTTEGTVEIILTGQDAVATRDDLRYLTPDELRVATSRIMHALNPLARRRGKLRLTGLEDLAAPVTIAGDFVIERGLPRAGGLLFTCLPRPELTRNYEDCRPERRSPLLVAGSKREILDLTLELPPGHSLLQAPEPHACHQPPLDLDFQVSRQGNKLHFRREIELQRAIIPAGTPCRQFLRQVVRLQRLENKTITLKQRQSVGRSPAGLSQPRQ